MIPPPHDSPEKPCGICPHQPYGHAFPANKRDINPGRGLATAGNRPEPRVGNCERQ